MSRDPRPTYVPCSGPCRRDRVDARTAREAVMVFPLTNSGKGGTHGAAGHLHTRVYVCLECWRQKLPKDPREVHILLERLATLARELLHFQIPKDDKQRDLFGNETKDERRVG